MPDRPENIKENLKLNKAEGLTGIRILPFHLTDVAQFYPDAPVGHDIFLVLIAVQIGYGSFHCCNRPVRCPEPDGTGSAQNNHIFQISSEIHIYDEQGEYVLLHF